MLRVYFAHPISDYSTAYEAKMETLIHSRVSAMYPHEEVQIENPNQPHHQEGYARKSMAYFLEDVLPACGQCVFDAFPGGIIGSGVAMEAKTFLDAGKQVWRVTVAPAYLSRVLALPECVASRDTTRELSKLFRTMPNGGRP